MNLLYTFIIACILIALAFLGLMIGWFVTGKPFARGSCGGLASRKKDGTCGKDQTCELCNPKKED